MSQFDTVGIITYQNNHLKTEQVLQRLISKSFKMTVFALPFVSRPKRSPLFQQRPNQEDGRHPEVIAQAHGWQYVACKNDLDIQGCDIYLVTGAGILSPECVTGKKIINCHPGVIPASRGLDAFKWAIYDGVPVGNSLHFIDSAIDAGELISVRATPRYSSDSLSSLARRHYEAEIDMLACFEDHIRTPINDFPNVEIQDARRRMPRRVEEELEEKFREGQSQLG